MVGTAKILGYRREWIFTAVILLAAASMRGFVRPGEWLFFSYLSLYLGWVWTPSAYRTLRNSLIFTGVAVLALLWAGTDPAYRALAESLLLPFAGILGSRGTQSAWPVLALILLAATRFTMSPSDIGQVVGSIMAMVGIYLAVYAVRLRREAQALDRERVVQIETAYADLQATHQKLVSTTKEVMESRARQAQLEMLADIHDGVGHRLTSLIVGLEALEMMLPGDPEVASGRLPDLVSTARAALWEVRQAVRARSEEEVLLDASAFEALIAHASVSGSFATEVALDAEWESMPATVRRTLYRVLQEALTNVLRHAKATRVRVVLGSINLSTTLTVADDGILVGAIEPGFGLTHLRQRCEALGGNLHLRRVVRHGLVVEAVLPGEHERSSDGDPDILGG